MTPTDKRILEPLGKQIKEARLAKKLTRYALARLANVHQTTVKNVEEALTDTPVSVYYKLLGALGIK